MNTRNSKTFLKVILVFLFLNTPFHLIAEENLTKVIKETQPSITVILTYDINGKPLSQGTGFFIDKNLIITNRHVILDASKIIVKIDKKNEFPVKEIVAEDKEGDLILLSIDTEMTFHALPLSNSIPEVGEKILVIGNPLGLEKTVSDGIVSAVREISSFGNIIQITAPISPGSSGSPVVNMNGEVVGVASFQVIKGQNLNFAIPSERIANLLKNKNKPKIFTEWKKEREKEWLSSAEGLYSMGVYCVSVEEYEIAIKYFKKAIEKNSDYVEAYFQLGNCYAELRLWNEAERAYLTAILLKPSSSDIYNNLGILYGKLNRLNDAVRVFKQAIHLNPDNAMAYFNLGLAYCNLKRWNEAAEAYKQVIRIKPDNAKAFCYLGIVYRQLEFWTYAIDSFKQAIRIDPNNYDAHCELGWTYCSLKLWEDAVDSFKNAIRINPSNEEAHYGLGWSYGNLCQWYESINELKQAIRIKPNYARAHLALGAVYVAIGDKGSALDEYKILKDLDRDMANKLFNLIYK